jgi:hypothetical protein
MAVNQPTENPGRVTDRGLLCWAVLGERGGARPAELAEDTTKSRTTLRAICRSAALNATPDACGSQPC